MKRHNFKTTSYPKRGDKTRYDKTHRGLQKHTQRNIMDSPMDQYVVPPYSIIKKLCSSYNLQTHIFKQYVILWTVHRPRTMHSNFCGMCHGHYKSTALKKILTLLIEYS